MTRNNIEQVSVRLPSELVKMVDVLKDREGIDRTAVINKAVRYWVEVDGKVLADNEYQNSLKNLSQKLENLEKSDESLIKSNKELADEIRELRGLLSEQQKTISQLIEIIAKFNPEIAKKKV